MKVALIMAGGFGKRLWPESRVSYPKQFLNVNGKESLLQASYRRATHTFGSGNTYIVTRKELEEPIVLHLPELSRDNVIVEPQGKDTAPCIGFSSIWIKEKRGDIPIIVLPADHVIKDEEKFAHVILTAAQQAEKGFLVTIGIKPTRVETGYGYLQIGKEIRKLNDFSLFKVDRFTEKPSYKKAKEFFEQGNFLWNAGIFAWKPSIILKEIKRFLPDLYRGLNKIEKALKMNKEKEIIKKAYSSFPKISIDYGIMEKSSSVVAVPADCFFWDDIGNWQSLERILSKDKEGNIERGLIKGSKNNNCTLINREDKILGAIGLSNLIIINTKNGILVVNKGETQKVKDLVDELLNDERLKKYVQ
ncbi:MAG: mannose-1-phosphate guanylyltransferase [Candidatus Aerophobetes bacterium]|nr:mannose-1-phosphate guanylyltransferase [Candidatus Aerophobetes bacterium]